MKGFHIVRKVNAESVERRRRDAAAVAKRQAEQLMLVRRRAQPAAVYITRMTLTAVFARTWSPSSFAGGSPRSVLAPLDRETLLVAQATLYHTIRSRHPAGRGGHHAGVVAAVADLRVRPVHLVGARPADRGHAGARPAPPPARGTHPGGADQRHADLLRGHTHAYATTRITESIVRRGGGPGRGPHLLAPLPGAMPAKDAVGDLARQMADLLGQMAEGQPGPARPRPTRGARRRVAGP